MYMYVDYSKWTSQAVFNKIARHLVIRRYLGTYGHNKGFTAVS